MSQCVCMCVCVFACERACERACVRACVRVCVCVGGGGVCTRARKLLCPPVCMFAHDCAGTWQKDQFEPGKTLRVKWTGNLSLEKVHAVMLQTRHSGIDIVSILISAKLEMESGRPFWLSGRTAPQST